MKYFRCSLIILISLISHDAKGQWTIINSGTQNPLMQIVFPDPITGYILTSKPMDTTTNSLVLKTTDGGYHWSAILSKRQGGLAGIDFLNADTGVVISSSNSDTIYKTYDGGSNWIKIKKHYDIGNLFHMNSVSEWIYLRGQHWGHTFDGGLTWVDSTNGNSGILPLITTDFQYLNSTTIIGFGGYGPEVFKSVDAGISWPILLNNVPNTINSGCFPTSMLGFYVSNSQTNTPRYSEIFKAVDGGVNWNQIDSISGYSINCIRYVDSDTLYAVGSGGFIVKTVNGGNTWIQESSGTTQVLTKIILQPNKAIAIGDSGTILINPGVGTGVIKINTEDNMFTIYPNPNTGTFTLSGNTNGRNAVINVFSMLGQIVYSDFVEATNGDVNRQICLNVPAGIYVLWIHTGNGEKVVQLVINSK